MIDGIVIRDNSSNQTILNFGSIFYKNQHEHLERLNQLINQNLNDSACQQTSNLNEKPILIQVLNHDQLSLIAITHEDIEPSTLLVFLNQCLQILKSHLNSPSITPYLIQSNFLIVLEIFDFFINFHSLASSSSAYNLFDYLLPNQKLLNQVFNLIQNSLNQSNQSITNSSSPNLKLSSIFNSPLPWRPIGLTYNKDEIYLDLIETLFITVDDDSKILKSNLVGKINVDSKLSGMPEVLLSFKDFNCRQIGFHPSIKYGKWKKDSIISFIPPNQSFTLLNYTSTLNQSPLKLKTMITSGSNGGSFCIEIHSINHYNLSNLKLNWFLGKLCNGLVSDQIQIKSINSANRNGVSPSGLNSSWDWDPTENHFKVQVGLLQAHQSISIQGLWNHSSIENKPSPEISVQFEILPELNLNYTSLIGLKVDKLMISDSNLNSNFHSTNFDSRQNQHQHPNQKQLSKGIKTKLDLCRILLRW